MGGSAYQRAGVDQDRADRAIAEAAALIASTHRPEVIPNPGGFAGLFALRGMADPVLVASTDGVGTKLRIAEMLGRHGTVGIDLVAMCVNDILVQGAEPLFFLDYLATARLDRATFRSVLEGIVAGCREAGCTLLGGETAEMPGMYHGEDYDLAGFVVGVVERERLLDGRALRAGDRLVGLESTGPHSNGFSLIRKVFLGDLPAEGARARLAERPPVLGGAALGEVLLRPTAIYVSAVRDLLESLGPNRALRALAHITGGGIPGNLPRVLPAGTAAVVRRGSWPVPPVFDLIREAGDITPDEMFDVFNMGVGMVAVVAPDRVEEALQCLARSGLRAHAIGEVVAGGRPPEVRLE